MNWFERQRIRYTLRHHAIPHEHWLELMRNNALFKGLSAVERVHLRTLTTLFLQRKTFSGVQGLTVSMEMAVTIAAQACLSILKLGLDYYDGWREVSFLEGKSLGPQYQAPTVVVENRVYRPRPYPYLYKPHHYRGEKKRGSHDSGSSLGLHLGGGSSTFHYGLSYGSQQSHSEDSAIQTPYSREQGHTRSSGLIKRRQN